MNESHIADFVAARSVEPRRVDDLPEGDLLVSVSHSSLNYKDALSARGNRGVTKAFPHTPGIDAVGTVAADGSGRFEDHTPVLVTGYDLGMNISGGWGEMIRVPAEWRWRCPRA